MLLCLPTAMACCSPDITRPQYAICAELVTGLLATCRFGAVHYFGPLRFRARPSFNEGHVGFGPGALETSSFLFAWFWGAYPSTEQRIAEGFVLTRRSPVLNYIVRVSHCDCSYYKGASPVHSNNQTRYGLNLTHG